MMNTHLNQRDIEQYIQRLQSVATSDEIPGYEKLLKKFRSGSPDKFVELCKMQLSFLLDLPSDVLTELSKASQISHKSFHHSETNGTKTMFTSGVLSNFCNYLKKVKVTQLVKSVNPQCISPLIKHLMTFNNGSFAEGLFRKTGNLVKQRLLLKRLTEAMPCSKEVDLSAYSQHDLACALKSLLQKCPIIHREISSLLVEVNSLKSCDVNLNSQENQLMNRLVQAKQLKAFRILCCLVDSPYRELLLDLLNLLKAVSRDPNTRMTASSLGTLFGPILLSQPDDSSLILHSNYHLYAQTMDQLIDLADNLSHVPLTLALDIKKNALKRRSSVNSRTLPGGSVHSAILSKLHISIGRGQSPSVTGDADSDNPLDTCVSFTSRSSSRHFSGDSHATTCTELSRLYQTISELPASKSIQKRKYIKRFAKSATSPKPYPEKLAHSHSLLPDTPESYDHSPLPFTFETPKRNMLKSWSSLISSSSSNSLIRRLPTHLKNPGNRCNLNNSSYKTIPFCSSLDVLNISLHL